MINYYLFANPLLTDEHTDPSWFFGTGVKWYGVFMSLAIFFSIICICLKLWKWYKCPVDPLYYFAIIAIPVSLIGARIWSMVIGDAGNFFNFKEGGLAIEGGVVAVVIAGLIYFPIVLKLPRYQKVITISAGVTEVRTISMWVYADAICPAILIGQVIGRWGNYFNQELFGEVTTNETLINFMKFFHLNLMQGLGQVDGSAMGDSGDWYQPLFLWEGLINLFGFLLIFVGMEFVPAKWKRAGDQAILYFIWYGIVRIILEPLRFSDFTFHTTYIMTSLWIGGGILLWLLNGFVFSNFRRYKLLKLVPAVIWLQTKQIYFYLCMIVANFFTFYRRMNKINVWYEAKTLHLEPEYQQAKTFKYMRNDGEMMWYRGM